MINKLINILIIFLINVLMHNLSINELILLSNNIIDSLMIYN